MRLAAVSVLLASCIIPAQPRGGGGGGGGYYGGGGGQPSGDPSAGTPAPGGENVATGGGAAAPGPVSVDIHSSCEHSVKVFYGDKPKFGSGTYSSIEGHSIESHTFNPGEMLWIVDDEENGIAGTAVGPGIHQIEIPETCSSLIAQ
jgi:hypothetical protein